MKPKPYFRIIFAVLVAAGSLFMLGAARKVSAENIAASRGSCETCATQELARSNTEFIFLQSVTKYLFISLVK